MVYLTTSASSNDVVILEQNEKAPFTGYLFTKEKAQSTRIKLIEGEEAIKLIPSYQRSLELYRNNEAISDKKVNILLEQNDNLAKQLASSRSVSSFEKTAWFIGGILVTGLATYGASKLVK